MTDTKPIGATTGHYRPVMKDTLVFDSHGYVKRMTDGGFNEHQAEALAAEQGDLLSNLATRQDMEAVRDDIETIKKNMATKDDLKNFATRDDLKNFATRDDLKNFATRDDLKNFATRDDLKNFATRDDLKNYATRDELKSEIAGLETRLVKWMVGSLFVFAGIIIASVGILIQIL